LLLTPQFYGIVVASLPIAILSYYTFGMQPSSEQYGFRDEYIRLLIPPKMSKTVKQSTENGEKACLLYWN